MKLLAVLFASVLLVVSGFTPFSRLGKFHIKPLSASLIELEVGPGKFDAEVTNSKVPVIVDFYANWCGPCKLVAPIFKALAEEYEDVKFVKVDTGMIDIDILKQVYIYITFNTNKLILPRMHVHLYHIYFIL